MWYVNELFEPELVESLAVKGFILSAQYKISEAQAAFDQAIALDGALGNAWLGRGLCRIRRGNAREGLQDLQVAAVLEVVDEEPADAVREGGGGGLQSARRVRVRRQAAGWLPGACGGDRRARRGAG